MEMKMRKRKRRSGLMRTFVVVLALWILQVGPLVSAASTSKNCSSRYLGSYPQMGAIGNLYTNWSGTPNLEVNLQGWEPVAFNASEDTVDSWWFQVCTYFMWKGLECFTFDEKVPGYMYNCTGTEITTTYQISGLTLNNASITGPLPSAIGDLYPLSSLTLTGNPGLHGNIPEEITKLEPSLTTLDLRDNNLSGAIPPPSIFRGLLKLLNLDMSGNRFTGKISEYPLRSHMRTFSLAHNQLTGKLFEGYFVDMP